jgi:hypothetical protein
MPIDQRDVAELDRADKRPALVDPFGRAITYLRV